MIDGHRAWAAVQGETSHLPTPPSCFLFVSRMLEEKNLISSLRWTNPGSSLTPQDFYWAPSAVLRAESLPAVNSQPWPETLRPVKVWGCWGRGRGLLGQVSPVGVDLATFCHPRATEVHRGQRPLRPGPAPRGLWFRNV